MKTNKNTLFLFLVLTCVIMWFLQSLPHIIEYYEPKKKVTKNRYEIGTTNKLPSVVFCNKLPYTRTGLESIGAMFQQEAYFNALMSWIDPGYQQDLVFERAPTNDKQISTEELIAQIMSPTEGFKQRVEQILPKCQDMIASCVIKGKLESGFECCRQVKPYLATTHNGICWIFKNSTEIEDPFDTGQLLVTFQISHNSFASNKFSHPGLKIFVVPEFATVNRIRLATELTHPIHLTDKMHLNFDLTSLELEHTRNSMCTTDEEVRNGNSKSYSLCLMSESVEACSCVPLILLLWTFQNDIEKSFLHQHQLTNHTLCTPSGYAKCTRRFLDLVQPIFWTPFPTKRDDEMGVVVDRCRKKAPVPCTSWNFDRIIQETHLSAEYQSTKDFVAQVSVSYSTIVINETKYSTGDDIIQLLSALSLNIAIWFAIGHMIWWAICFVRARNECTSKVVPVGPTSATWGQRLVPAESGVQGGSKDVKNGCVVPNMFFNESEKIVE